MVRTPYYDKNGVKRGEWSPEEDRKLMNYIQMYGHWNWRELPKFAGLARCGKSCRLRWMNYLRPDVKRGNYTKEEEDLIIKLHQKLGNKWSKIAAELPGRTDNEIKNHWHTHLRKKSMKKSKLPTKGRKKQWSENVFQSNDKEHRDHIPSGIQILESFPLLSPQQSSNNDFSTSTTLETANSSPFPTNNSFMKNLEENILSSSNIFPELDVSFWNEPFVLDNLDILYNDFEISNMFIDNSVLLSPRESYYEAIEFPFQVFEELNSLDNYLVNNDLI